jgi:ferredoxin
LDAAAAHAGSFAEDAESVGRLRETCPHCSVPLQLVLRYRHVIRTHLYCESCGRCFDACLPDGSSALTRPALPVA